MTDSFSRCAQPMPEVFAGMSVFVQTQARRWRLANTIALLLLLCVNQRSVAQESFPYEASVSSVRAIVHAAPSANAYATEQLERGARVEVYRLDPGGWCAIRPPVGSFSLIPVDALRETGDPMVAALARDSVKAWVGTRIESRSQPLWQVKLSEGELVELLKPWEETISGGEWALIAPPAGEFRWVHERELRAETAPASVMVPDAPLIPSQTIAPSSTQLAQANPSSSPTTSDARDNSVALGATDASQAAASGTSPLGAMPIADQSDLNPRAPQSTASPTTTPTSLAPQSLASSSSAQGQGSASATPSTSPMPQPNSNLAENDSTGGWRRVGDAAIASDAQTSLPVNSSATNTAAAGGTATEGSFAQRLSQAQRWFDAQLAGKASVTPERLMVEVQQLEQLARSPQERQGIQDLSQRVSRWQDLELRRLALERLSTAQGLATNNSSNANNSSNIAASGVAGSAPNNSGGRFPASLTSLTEMLRGDAAPNNSGNETPNFAAEGVLTRMIREGGLRSSSYAIQDSTGKVVALVVPGPGVNLERYLRKQVGVMGSSSPNPTLKLPTVIAERVVELNR